MDADYIKWLADYLSDFVSYNKGVFTFKHLKAENVSEIINYLVKVRNLGDEVSEIIITKDINNEEGYSLENSNCKNDAPHLGSYLTVSKKLYIKLDDKSNVIDVCLTILHELEHAHQIKMIKTINKDDSEIGFITALYFLDYYAHSSKYPYAEKDFKINKEIKQKLNNAHDVQYRTLPCERFANLNSTSDMIKIIRLMGYGNTILARNYEFKYRDYLDCGYYQTKNYTLNPLHLFLLRLYNQKVISKQFTSAMLDLLEEYTKDLDDDKKHFLGLRYDSKKKSNKNV